MKKNNINKNIQPLCKSKKYGITLPGFIIVLLCNLLLPVIVQSAELEVIPLRNNMDMIAGAGANIVVHHGEDGVIVVDSGSGDRTEEVLEILNQIGGGVPIRYVINTSANPDNVGGNEALSLAGEPFVARVGLRLDPNLRSELSSGAIIYAQENVLFHMAENGMPISSWPVEGYATPSGSIRLNGEGMEIKHFPVAYSSADSIVDFRGSDVFVVGQLIDATRFPQINLEQGGSVNGLLAALNELIWMVIPELPLTWREGGSLVVPAKGRVYRHGDVVQYRDMVTIIRDRVYTMIEQGMSLQEVQDANPAFGFIGQWGDDTPGSEWTTEMFIEAVYISLLTEMQAGDKQENSK